MYKLLKDKNNEFQCEIKLEGASASTAKVRLFLEGDECEYVFTGRIQDDHCTIPLGKLKKFANLLEHGKIRLEVIADDTVFVPYESDYQLEAEKKVTVEVKQPGSTPKKSMVEVKVTEPAPTKKTPLDEIKKYFKERGKFDGTLKSFYTIIKDKQHKDYFNTICESYKLDKASIVKQLLK